MGQLVLTNGELRLLDEKCVALVHLVQTDWKTRKPQSVKTEVTV